MRNESEYKFNDHLCCCLSVRKQVASSVGKITLQQPSGAQLQDPKTDILFPWQRYLSLKHHASRALKSLPLKDNTDDVTIVCSDYSTCPILPNDVLMVKKYSLPRMLNTVVQLNDRVKHYPISQLYNYGQHYKLHQLYLDSLSLFSTEKVIVSIC